MKQSFTNARHHWSRWFVGVFVLLSFLAAIGAAQQAPANKTSATTATQSSPEGARGFDTPQKAAAALIDAAGKFDVTELTHIFGSDLEDVIFSGEYAQDRQHAADFVAQAREKNSLSV